MSMREREHEERLQAEAEAAERQGLPAGGNAPVNEYRLVLRALRRPPPEALAPDFAARVAARLLASEERGSMEDWMVTVLMLAMATGGAYFLRPILAEVLGSFHLRLPVLPWPLLAAGALALFVAWALDRGATSWRSHH